jgi:NAD(P) transhydrogenase subunit beta
MKRSMATGYAGVQNPLFFNENTRMLFGDAKASVDAILASV